MLEVPLQTASRDEGAPPELERGADRGRGDVEMHSLRSCSCDLSWFGPGRLQDPQGPEVLLAPGH